MGTHRRAPRAFTWICGAFTLSIDDELVYVAVKFSWPQSDYPTGGLVVKAFQ
jgi:hypothetical protein